jgi:3-oxoadipate enol-lactonase
MPHLELPDCKLFYQIDDHTNPWTHSEAVVFVHGFTENTEAWRAWVPHFSRSYRVIRYDQRGFGQSGPVAKDFPLTTEVIVGDLAAVIKQLANGDRVHVVGGKSGGIPVMMLAAMHPRLVKTITVSCSPVTPPQASGWIDEMERDGMRSWAHRTQRERIGSSMPQAGIEWWSDMMGATAVSTAHAYLRWVGAIDIREDIRRIKCPTLVIGTDTPRRGKAEFESWQKTIPGSELNIIPVDGYHAAGSAPDETANVAFDFIARHSS